MKEPFLRFATPDDAAALYRLIVALATYEREPDAVVTDAETLGAQLGSEKPPFECLVADTGDEVVAFALFFHNYSTWRGRRGLYLEDLFVDLAHRGRGIGRRLLGELARIAVERGCARMEWSVLDWNAPAIGFYRSLGATPLEGWTIYRLTGEPLERLAR